MRVHSQVLVKLCGSLNLVVLFSRAQSVLSLAAVTLSCQEVNLLTACALPGLGYNWTLRTCFGVTKTCYPRELCLFQRLSSFANMDVASASAVNSPFQEFISCHHLNIEFQLLPQRFDGAQSLLRTFYKTALQPYAKYVKYLAPGRLSVCYFFFDYTGCAHRHTV